MDYQINGNWITFIVPETYDQKPLQSWLDAFVPSRTRQHLLFQNKKILLDGTPLNRQSMLHRSLALSIEAFDTAIHTKTSAHPLDVIYEDAFFLIVNKPSQLLVHPDHPHQTQTLVHQIANYYHLHHMNYPVRPIHRLDTDTSGLLFVNKCALFQPLMDQLLAKKQIYRTYLAVVDGPFSKTSGFIDQPIGSDRHVNNRYRIAKNGKQAITKYQVIKQTKQQALVACTLETGRTHQIRVHMASIHHPILFDPIYGTPVAHRTLALHAWKLTFFHPILEKNITLTCPPPANFPMTDKTSV